MFFFGGLGRLILGLGELYNSQFADEIGKTYCLSNNTFLKTKR